tara:strand:- start:273 stop:860 length:588 start_codon:yes stop_codon:yes gene_type:complete
MANENTYVVTGLVDQLDNKDIAQAFVEGKTQRAGKPLRVLLKDQSGSAKWYGTFDKNCMRTIMNGGEQSGPWTLTCETTYKGQYVNEMIKEAVLTQSTTPAPTQPAPAAPVPATPATTQPLRGMDDRGLSIIRQVAFKAAVDVVLRWPVTSDPTMLEDYVSRRTDSFMSIILGTYVPTPDEETPPADEQYIQQEF